MEPINRYLDHAVLKPNLTRDEAREAILLGVHYEVRTVCVRPWDVPLAVELTRGTTTGVGTVIGFPHGTNLSNTKRAEARDALAAGAVELDMVANYGALRSGDLALVQFDIAAVVEEAHAAGALVKVILETSQLTLDEVRTGVLAAIDAGADFAKTSTGFTGDGAAEDVVRVMLDTAAGRIRIKPSGGIRDQARAVAFVEMGAARIGVGYTSTQVICEGGEGGGAGY